MLHVILPYVVTRPLLRGFAPTAERVKTLGIGFLFYFLLLLLFSLLIPPVVVWSKVLVFVVVC